MANERGVYSPAPSAPAAVPYRFGLFSVLSPSPPIDHWRVGVSWESQACGEAFSTLDDCVAGSAVQALRSDTACYVSYADPFTIYGLYRRSIAGNADASDAARERLLTGEQEAVEKELWALLVAAATGTSAPLAAAAHGIAYALGLVEQQLAEQYGNQGVIHCNRVLATMLADGGALTVVGGKLTTALGTPVVAGGGYQQIGQTIPTTATIYGTGPLVMYRGEPQVLNTTQLPINDVVALASRDYVVGWDCVVVGATVTI